MIRYFILSVCVLASGAASAVCVRAMGPPIFLDRGRQWGHPNKVNDNTLQIVYAARRWVAPFSPLFRILCAIENFRFQFTAITSQRSSGGISGMYASLGRRICSAKDSQEAADIIKELRKKLSERIPSESEFVALFPELIYTNTLSKQRALVKYVLVKIAKYDQVALPGDWDDLTIEHVIPQAKIDDDTYSDELVGQLGNLILVPSKMNEKLNEKPFSDKKKNLLAAKYPLPDEMVQTADWTPDLVEKRTKSLALKASQKVWCI